MTGISLSNRSVGFRFGSGLSEEIRILKVRICSRYLSKLTLITLTGVSLLIK